MPASTVNTQRLSSTLEALGRIGETPEGMQRIAFSAADVEGRRYVMELMRQAGLSVRIDPAGNIIARRPGERGPGPGHRYGVPRGHRSQRGQVRRSFGSPGGH